MGSIVPRDCYECRCGKGVETGLGHTTKSATKDRSMAEPKLKARMTATGIRKDQKWIAAGSLWCGHSVDAEPLESCGDLLG